MHKQKKMKGSGTSGTYHKTCSDDFLSKGLVSIIVSPSYIENDDNIYHQKTFSDTNCFMYMAKRT